VRPTTTIARQGVTRRGTLIVALLVAEVGYPIASRFLRWACPGALS
jgi:hypothetical protein